MQFKIERENDAGDMDVTEYATCGRCYPDGRDLNDNKKTYPITTW